MIRTLMSCAVACCAALAAHAQNSDPFPRIGAYLISNPRDYHEQSYVEQIAKLDWAVLSVYPGWEATREPFENVVRRIKAINPNTRIYIYFLPESQLYPVTPAYADMGVKLDSMRWWLYQTGSGPTMVLSDFGRENYIINLTAFTPADSNGRRANQWLPRYVVDTLVDPNPSIDGIYTDNVFWKPRRNGDWNRDGTTDDQNSATVQRWYREGNKIYLNTLVQLMPGKMQLANIADWGDPSAVLTEYDQLLPGGIMEGIMGASWSAESRLGWNGLLAWYRKSMAALAPPKLGLFHQFGLRSDFQSFRYGFATCLLDDGYYGFTEGNYNRVEWFDEFDVELGQASSTPPGQAWQKGVWRRDFEHGVALVNPKGNGSQTVTLEHDFRKIAGTQDRAVNTGQVVRTVTLRDRDGIILLRTHRRPRAPTAVRLLPPT